MLSTTSAGGVNLLVLSFLYIYNTFHYVEAGTKDRDLRLYRFFCLFDIVGAARLLVHELILHVHRRVRKPLAVFFPTLFTLTVKHHLSGLVIKKFLRRDLAGFISIHRSLI